MLFISIGIHICILGAGARNNGEAFCRCEDILAREQRIEFCAVGFSFGFAIGGIAIDVIPLIPSADDRVKSQLRRAQGE